jgi:hypothetical protein
MSADTSDGSGAPVPGRRPGRPARAPGDQLGCRPLNPGRAALRLCHPAGHETRIVAFYGQFLLHAPLGCLLAGEPASGPLLGVGECRGIAGEHDPLARLGHQRRSAVGAAVLQPRRPVPLAVGLLPARGGVPAAAPVPQAHLRRRHVSLRPSWRSRPRRRPCRSSRSSCPRLRRGTSLRGGPSRCRRTRSARVARSRGTGPRWCARSRRPSRRPGPVAGRRHRSAPPRGRGRSGQDRPGARGGSA